MPLSCRGGAAPGCNPIVRLQPDCALQVQRQSCDLVAAINAILDVQPAAEHVMMMEDDWLFCPHGLESLRYFLAKAYRYDPAWLALRVSYGFNGVVVHQAASG